MVAAGEVDALGVSNLQGDEQGYSFHRIVAAINEVAHEEVVGERYISPNGEEFNEIVQLSVDISTDSHWHFDWGCIGLLEEDSSSLLSDELYLLLSDGFETFQVVDYDIELSLIPHQF